METVVIPSGAELAGYGRVMFSRLTVVTAADGSAIGVAIGSSNVVRLAAGGGDGTFGALPSANDNVAWVGDEDGTGAGGVIGRDPQATALISGETIVTWVDVDGQLQGKAYTASGATAAAGESDLDPGALDTGHSANDASALTALLKNIATLAPDQRYRLVETGRDSFSVLWAATIAGVLVLTGRQFKPDTEDSQGWVSSNIPAVSVEPGFRITTDFAVLGWSAEAGDITVSYALDGPDGTQVHTQAVSLGDLVEVASAGADGAASSPQATGSSTPYSVLLKDTTQAGETGDATTAPATSANPSRAQDDLEPLSIHDGIVDVAGTGGKVLVGGTYEERDGVEGLSEGDVVSHDDDVLEGTEGDDVIIGDLPDAWAGDGDDSTVSGATVDGPFAGGDDQLSGGLGDDVIYGGGGDDVISGGGDNADRHGGDSAGPRSGDGGTPDQPSIDTAVFLGSGLDYSITANGDGTYTVILARSDTGDGIDRGTTGFEGVDTTSGIEQYQFLDGDIEYIVRLVNGEDIATLDTSGHRIVLGSDLFQLPEIRNEDTDIPADGTPSAWGLTRGDDGEVNNTIAVTTAESDDGAARDIEAPVVAATGDGGFAVGWVEDGALRVKLYDELGHQDGAAVNVKVDPGREIATDVAPVMDAAGDGVAVAFVTTATGSDDDGSGTSGGTGQTEISVQLAGFGDGASAEAPAPTLTIGIDAGGAATSLDIASGDADSPHLTLAWVQSDSSGQDRCGSGAPANGDIVVQRLAIEVGGDSTTTIAAVDLDGGTDQGGAPVVIGSGHSAAVVATENDGFAVVWVAEGDGAAAAEADTQQHIEGRVFSSVGATVETFVLPIEDGRSVRDGTRPTIDTTGDGSIAITWQEVSSGSSALSVMSALLRQLDDGGWAEPIIRELRHFDEAPGEISVAIAGENGDALVLTWRTDGEGGGEITGQRFSIEALADGAADAAVGATFEIAGPSGQNDADCDSDERNDSSGPGNGRCDDDDQDCSSGSSSSGSGRDQSSVVGLDDGRVIVVMRETAPGDGAAPEVSIQVEMFDTRNPDDVIISVDNGAGADGHVGTIGDDIIDGRAGQDQLHGGLGDDTLTAGTSDDYLDGGEGDDSLLGGTGSDQLFGGAGDDLLMGGFGRDHISGGDGVDTVSYRGETRDVIVDLEAGTVRSDADHNAVDATAEGGAGLEDILAHDIENIEGGLGNDTLRGNADDNAVTGGKGDDVIDGRGGRDTARYSGSSADYDISLKSDGSIEVKHARNTSGAANDGTDQLRNIEELAFEDGRFALNADGTLAASSIAAALGIASEISVAAVECFQFVDLASLDNSGSSCNKGSGSGSSGSGSSGSGSSGSGSSGSGCDQWSSGPSLADDLCGFGSDTLYFGDLDALNSDNSGSGKRGSDNCGLDGLDYSSCTSFASLEQIQLDIEAAIGFYGQDNDTAWVDSLTTSDSFDLKPLHYDQCQTEFRIG